MSDEKNELEKKFELYADQYKRHLDQQKNRNEGLGEFYNYFFAGLPEESAKFLDSLLNKGIKLGSGLAFLMKKAEHDPKLASTLRSSVNDLKSNKAGNLDNIKSQDGDTANE